MRLHSRIMINRAIEKQISDCFDFEKAIIIIGARQVGKTTLIKSLVSEYKNVLWVDGDDPQDRNIWSDVTKSDVKQFIAEYEFIVFDEAQRIKNIGLAVKMILDMKLQKQLIVSGSSPIDINSSIKEPLTGRKWTFELFPLSWGEIINHQGLLNSIKATEQLMIYGTYPEIFSNTSHKKTRLRELASSYLFKDLFTYANIRKPDIIVELLEALAYQIGNEVSYHELSNMLKIDHATIKRYIGLLEDSFVIFRLPPLSTNPRKEISTSRKIYFHDNGIRNAIINNFSPLKIRSDKGALWENYIISEIYKINKYSSDSGKLYFWRSKAGSEIDIVIQQQDQYNAYELKYNPSKKVRFTPSFIKRYQPKKTEVINTENYYNVLKEMQRSAQTSLK